MLPINAKDNKLVFFPGQVWKRIGQTIGNITRGDLFHLEHFDSSKSSLILVNLSTNQKTSLNHLDIFNNSDNWELHNSINNGLADEIFGTGTPWIYTGLKNSNYGVNYEYTAADKSLMDVDDDTTPILNINKEFEFDPCNFIPFEYLNNPLYYFSIDQSIITSETISDDLPELPFESCNTRPLPKWDVIKEALEFKCAGGGSAE